MVLVLGVVVCVAFVWLALGALVAFGLLHYSEIYRAPKLASVVDSFIDTTGGFLVCALGFMVITFPFYLLVCRSGKLAKC